MSSASTSSQRSLSPTLPPVPPPPPTTSLLQGNLLRFLSARLAATQALHIYLVAIAWHLYALTGSALDLGLIGLFQFIPSMVMLLIVGHIIDRHDRLTVLRLSQVVSAISFACLAWATFSGFIQRDLIFAFVFVCATSRVFEGPTQQAILPSLVPTTILSRAIAAVSSIQELGTIVGPAIGGLLCMISPEAAYVTSTVLYLISVVLLGFVKPLPADDSQAHSPAPAPSVAQNGVRATLQNLFAGFRYVRHKPVLLGAMTLDMAATLLGGVTALLPVYAEDVLHIGAWGLGLLRSGSAVGALLMAVVLTRHPLRHNVGKRLFLAVAIYGFSVILFGLSEWLWLSFFALVLLGAADMISVVVRGSLAQLETPNEMRGRVGAVSFTCINVSSQIGQLQTGLAAAWLGPVPAIVIGGLGAWLVVGIWIRAFPALYHRNQLHETAEPETAAVA